MGVSMNNKPPKLNTKAIGPYRIRNTGKICGEDEENQININYSSTSVGKNKEFPPETS